MRTSCDRCTSLKTFFNSWLAGAVEALEENVTLTRTLTVYSVLCRPLMKDMILFIHIAVRRRQYGADTLERAALWTFYFSSTLLHKHERKVESTLLQGWFPSNSLWHYNHPGRDLWWRGGFFLLQPWLVSFTAKWNHCDLLLRLQLTMIWSLKYKTYYINN